MGPVGLAVAAVACATPQSDALLQTAWSGPPRVEWRDVPFHAQERHHCGPASLASLLAAAGEAVTPESLVDEVYSPERRGTLPPSLLAAVRRHGRLAFPVRRLEVLLQEVAAGHPVLVLQNLGLAWLPRWHYAVVVGYDLEARHVVLRSGDRPRRLQPLRVFERTWRRAGSFGLLALPPGEMPAVVDEASYLEAAAGLEAAGQAEAARRAYRVALRRWPASLGAWIGLGNAAYAVGDLEEAERAFREAAHQHPESAAALNNLAHVLAEQGRLGAARAALDRALRAGGTPAVLRDTQSLIEERERAAAASSR